MSMQMETTQVSSAGHVPEDIFQRGLALSVGRGGRTDLIEAHACFNVAALRGNSAAVGRREEIARELDRAEIARALRAARELIARH